MEENSVVSILETTANDGKIYNVGYKVSLNFINPAEMETIKNVVVNVLNVL